MLRVVLRVVLFLLTLFALDQYLHYISMPSSVFIEQLNLGKPAKIK